ncbi:MAG: DHH family phosphoesterase [Lachnospiraceae bacterium]|nr:DHH family phosphoesterase [Lachnospiraceae bacterium]
MAAKLKVKGKLRSYLQTPFLLGIILLLVNVAVYLVNRNAGYIVSGYTVLYFVFIGLMMIIIKPDINRELVTFAAEYGQIQKQILKNLELPYALLDENGKIIWFNGAFEDITEKEKLNKKTIMSLIPQIQKSDLPPEDGMAELKVKHEEKDYLVRMKGITLKEMAMMTDTKGAEDYQGYLIAIYFFDETALNLALQEVDNQSLVVGMIYIDNYDEALESVDDVGRSLLGAYIDRALNQYVNAIDGILRKTEKDKYLMIIRKSALAQLKEEKFTLLEEVKGINIGNTIAMTLSIGIGVDGLTYAQNCEFARNAIDLALGRGGDQAVVKSRENLTYYGGKSEQKETTTRVRARVKAQALEEIISGRDRIYVMGHRNGDMDSFGAAVGVCCAAQSLHKKCHIVLAEEVNPSLQPLVSLYRESADCAEDTILTPEQALENADEGKTAVIVVDINRPSITECPELLKKCKTIIVLDHHRQGAEAIENATLSYIEPNASSACEMVAEILQYFGGGVKFKGVVADSLYSGIVLDTQNFTVKTGVRTFEAAAGLRRNGADVTRVRKMFREDPADYKAKAETTRLAEIYKKEYAISSLKPEGIKNPTVIAAQAANDLLGMKGVKASFVMTEFQGKIYISARSIDEVNVQVIMEKLGGGGHMNVAGAQMENTTIEAAVIVLKSTLDNMIQEGEL